MSHVRVTLPAVTLPGGLPVCSTTSYGKAKYPKKK
jgi:hypothetical protein